jgi:pimeloyl-ACP methyl ester carboxylesterase
MSSQSRFRRPTLRALAHRRSGDAGDCGVREARPRRRFVRRAVPAAALAATLAAGCGGSDEPSPNARAASGPTGGADVELPGGVIDGSFDVGGHKLYMRCQGSGSPTVVYLHGYIHDPSGGGSANAGAIPDQLATRNRVCVYDRANVGRSEPVAGPLTGASSVEDLHRLLDTAGMPPPYVLLGASYGGLIAAMYAATYPQDVQGMVLLDPALAGDTRIEKLLPAGERLQPDHWKSETEKLDQLVTDRQALKLAGREPQVPVTVIATKSLDLPPTWPRQPITRIVRSLQHEFVGRFERGRLLILDVPHYMEPAIPERIADETRAVIGG